MSKSSVLRIADFVLNFIIEVTWGLVSKMYLCEGHHKLMKVDENQNWGMSIVARNRNTILVSSPEIEIVQK